MGGWEAFPKVKSKRNTDSLTSYWTGGLGISSSGKMFFFFFFRVTPLEGPCKTSHKIHLRAPEEAESQQEEEGERESSSSRIDGWRRGEDGRMGVMEGRAGRGRLNE